MYGGDLVQAYKGRAFQSGGGELRVGGCQEIFCLWLGPGQLAGHKGEDEIVAAWTSHDQGRPELLA